MHIKVRLKAGPWILLALAGCTVGPDFDRPSPWSPASWLNPHPAHQAAATASVAVAAPIEPAWWDAFGDPDLTALVRRVASSNLDVRAATERVAQSRAALRVTGTAAYPELNANASYTRELSSAKGVLGLLGDSDSNTATQANGLGGRQGASPSGSTAVPPFDLWQYGFDASWELDLWGRVRRNIENGDAQLDAQVNGRRDTLLSAVAEIARDYLDYRGQQEILRITLANLDSARRSAALTQQRSASGLASELDVETARSQVAATAAIVPQVEQRQAQLVNALGLLVGEGPGALADSLAAPRAVPPAPPRVPVGVPSELARRRPDIRQAEATLHAATASIGAAKADFFPKVTLSGSVAIQALQFKDLGNWDARSYGFGPSVSIPIFEGGRLRATLALREAQQREAAATYQKTVLGAFRDVDDALSGFAAEQRRRDQLAEQVRASRRALDLASDLYARGLTDYLQVLTAQRTLLSGQQSLAESTTTVSTDLVALYKALGGGWDVLEPDLPRVAQAAR